MERPRLVHAHGHDEGIAPESLLRQHSARARDSTAPGVAHEHIVESDSGTQGTRTWPSR